MIISLIFFLHFLFGLVIFVRKWQEESLSAAFINIGLIIILFSVGWSIFTMITKLIFEPEGFGIWFDRDTITLTILSVTEYFFFRFYYSDIISQQEIKTE
ncbi:MAG: hypothetical protein J5I57_00985 [Melioribacteraceae bacterium]|jgi:uncharacterized membrane protein YhdT|nr:hypothetical protein [Melioribacteraceae bacterium]